MNDFERTYQIDPLRELIHANDKHPVIELSDLEHLEKLIPVKLTKDTKVINLPTVESPKVSMNLEMPELEKSIKKGKKNAKSKSEMVKKSNKKVPSKSNHSTMASI